MFIRAWSLVSRLHCLKLSLNTHFPRSFLPSTVSIQAQSLIYPLRVHHVIQAQPLVSYPYRVNSSAAMRVPPQPGPFERDPSFPTHTVSIRSCPTFTVSSQARSVVSHPYHVNSSATARLPPPPCPLKLDCSPPTPTVSIWAQLLVSHPDHVPSGPSAVSRPDSVSIRARTHLPPSPCPFEPGRSSSTSSLSAHLPPQPFEPGRSSSTPTVSLRA